MLSGISLTAFVFRMPFAHPFSVTMWPVAAIGSAIGGFIIPSSKTAARVLAVASGFLFGALAYWFSHVVADRLTNIL